MIFSSSSPGAPSNARVHPSKILAWPGCGLSLPLACCRDFVEQPDHPVENEFLVVRHPKHRLELGLDLAGKRLKPSRREIDRVIRDRELPRNEAQKVWRAVLEKP